MTEKPYRSVDEYIVGMHRQNSDTALQAAIELMLTDRPSKDVIAALKAWTEYLEDRV